MNWHNLSSSEFDAQVKEHLMDSSVPFDPESWNKMNRKLDMAFPGDSTSRNGVYELLIIAFLLSSIFFWNLFNFSKQDLLAADAANTQPVVESTIPPATSTVPNGSKYQSSSQNGGSLTIQGNKQRTNYQSSRVEVSDHSSVNNTSNNNVVVSPTTSESPDPSKNVSYTNSLLSSSYTESYVNNHHTADEVGDASDVPQERYHQGLQESDKKGMPVVAPYGANIGYMKQSKIPDSIHTQVSDLSVPVVQLVTSRWLIGFGYAPDISLVGFGETTSPGMNLAVLGEYKLNDRWSLNTGIAYSKKKYLAEGNDYHPPEGFWGYGAVPDYTDAVCEVIEIPVNLRYYLRPAQAHRIFFGTGLSSYFMLTEDYSYEYENNYDPDLINSWSVNNENQHFLSIYNLSVGYQRAIGAQWLIEIEPFIKAPLAGVGFGEVDLWSTGSFFSIKYNFK
jgi:hypothetical protein